MPGTSVWFYVLLRPESHPFIAQNIDQYVLLHSLSFIIQFVSLLSYWLSSHSVSLIDLLCPKSWPCLTQTFCTGMYMCALPRDFTTCFHFIYRTFIYYTLVFVMLLNLQTYLRNKCLNYFVFAYRKTSKSCSFLKKTNKQTMMHL